MSLLSSLIGFCLVLLRFAPLARGKNHKRPVGEDQNTIGVESVSIVIPARNEAANLPTLLKSLSLVNHQNLEIVVIDDESTDWTREVAESFALEHPRMNIKVIAGQPRPPGWTGKNWACHQGFHASTGRWLLFTDADTEHLPNSLPFALKAMRDEDLDLLSATPIHRCEAWWEKGLGPFQLLLFLSTAAFSKPRLGRVFAIGQYLLFKRESYERQGGHEAIREILCDDLELARRCLAQNGRYRVEGRVPLFRVRMYATIQDFVDGWRRNFRLGFKHASLMATVEIYFVIAVLTANMKFIWSSSLGLGLMFATALVFAWVQRRFGNFSLFGILLIPVNIALFVLVSLLAMSDLIRQRDYVWRGRSYQRTAD